MKVAKMLLPLLLLLEVFGCSPRVKQLPQSAGGAGRGKARLGSSLEFCSMFLGTHILRHAHTYAISMPHSIAAPKNFHFVWICCAFPTLPPL